MKPRPGCLYVAPAFSVKGLSTLMEPNANLAEQRRIAARIIDGRIHRGDAARLADLVEALDNWLLGGGALPSSWGKAGRKEGT